MPESPPVSPKTVRPGKRSRQSSKGETSISEISQEDLGYDGDVEVVRPDEVEEPESDFEKGDDDAGLGLRRLLWPDTDEELVTKLKRLGLRARTREHRDHSTLEKPGSKRLSKEADPTYLNQNGKRTELEVSEMLDGQSSLKHLKKRKESRFSLAKRNTLGTQGMQTSTSETEVREMTMQESSIVGDGGNDEEMDLD